MKVAGKKNDGAWFRMNKKIANLTEVGEKENLADLIAATPTIGAAYSAVMALATSAGLVMTGIPGNGAEWATNLVERGIPRQIWMGRLSWTTTTKTESLIGSDEYEQDHQSEIHAFAKDLRAVCYSFFLTRRQLRDIFDLGSALEGNPTGHPDAVFEP